MLKLLGSLCILAAGGAIRQIRVGALRKELLTLRELRRALMEMKDEIRLNRTPLPRLLRKAGENSTDTPVSTFLKSAAGAAETGGFPNCWREGITRLMLREDTGSALAELGNALCGDEETSCKGISLVIAQLSNEIQEKQQLQPDAEKRSTALCYSSAAMLIILLI